MIAGEKAAVDSKQKIRARYRGVDPSELEVIPAIAKAKGRCLCSCLHRKR